MKGEEIARHEMRRDAMRHKVKRDVIRRCEVSWDEKG